MRLTLPVLLSLLLISCGWDKPKTLDRRMFVEVYTELLEARLIPVIGTVAGDTSLSAAAESTLTRKQATAEQFRETVRAFGRDPQQWKEVMEEVASRLEAKTDSIRSAASSAGRAQ